MLNLLPSLLLALAPQAPSFAPEGEPKTVRIPVLRNGDFESPLPPSDDPELAGRLPWWKVLSGDPTVARDERGPFLWMQAGDIVQQPMAAWAGAADEIQITLDTAGPITVTPVDGLGGSAGDVPLSGVLGKPMEFSFGTADLQRGIGRRVVPRFSLQFHCEAGSGSISALSALGTFPCPDEDALRGEIVETLAWSFAEFAERALDDVGPRATSFVVHDFDVDSGERIGAPFARVTYHPLWGQLLDAWAAEPRADWEALLEGFVSDFLELGMHPATGIPRYYDPIQDRPLDDAPIEIRVHLEFLLDLAEYGPESTREPALAAARRMGEQVLSTGVLPDGSICARYLPSTGEASPGVVPIRRLDVPAALARLGAMTGDTRLRDAAHEAVVELSYDHYWPGSWDRIDPGFDDNFGHYGERATSMWAAWPEVEAFRQLSLSGLERYLPLWRDALRFGGNVAADQVRCWRIAAEVAHLEPSLAEEIAARIDDAVWVHFTGQQVAGGHWIDTTIVGHDPQRLPVGDTAGVPQNLLDGLGLAYQTHLGLDRESLRARFTAVMRTTLQTYGGPHGLIATGARIEGAPNSSVGSLRFHPGLVEMLSQLPRGD